MSESQDEAMVRSITRECVQVIVGEIPSVPLDRVRWLLAKVGELKAKNSELQMLVKHDVAVEPYEREKIAVLEGELKGLVAKHDRLRAENETLRQQLDGDWPEERLSDAYEKLAVKRDAEIAALRATALTASEAKYTLYEVFDRNDEYVGAPTEAWCRDFLVKLKKIAHPEPQEGKR